MTLQRHIVLVAVSLISISGCVLHGDYLIRQGEARAVMELPVEGRDGVAVRGTRVGDGKSVLVRARYLESIEMTGSGDPNIGVRGRAAAPSPEVAAGAVLTCIGSVMSVVGTLGYLVLRGGVHDDAALGFGITELIAEPVMIVGTILWIHGLVRPAQEVRPKAGKMVIEPSGLIRF